MKRKTERAEDTSPNWVLTNIQTQTALGSPHDTAHLESQLGKGPRQCIQSRVRLQIAVSRAPTYNSRHKNAALTFFNFYNAVCFTSRILLDPRVLARPPGAQEFRNLLSYLKCRLTCCVCRQAWNPGSTQAGQKWVRGLLSCF